MDCAWHPALAMETLLALCGAALFEPFTWHIGPKREEVTRSRENYTTRS